MEAVQRLQKAGEVMSIMQAFAVSAATATMPNGCFGMDSSSSSSQQETLEEVEQRRL
jgi:hypothetical protein